MWRKNNERPISQHLLAIAEAEKVIFIPRPFLNLKISRTFDQGLQRSISWRIISTSFRIISLFTLLIMTERWAFSSSGSRGSKSEFANNCRHSSLNIFSASSKLAQETIISVCFTKTPVTLTSCLLRSNNKFFWLHKVLFSFNLNFTFTNRMSASCKITQQQDCVSSGTAWERHTTCYCCHGQRQIYNCL